MMEAAIYSFIYLLVMLGGAVALMGLGYAAVDSIFESASAQGNVGLSVGITSTFMPAIGKVVLITQMLVGRLEIIPVIAFIAYFVAKIPRPPISHRA
jgi:trk system potassium uptake protein TrkH